MKTSELIIKLVNSLKEYGDLPIFMLGGKRLDIGWCSPTEGGKPIKIEFDIIEDIELTYFTRED